MNALLQHAVITGDLTSITQFNRSVWQPYRQKAVECLRIACSNGRLLVAQWLRATFYLRPEDVRIYDINALMMACANGHLQTAQWLYEAFDLRQVDVRKKDNYALRMACCNGYLHVARWLFTTFKLYVSPAQRALDQTCNDGHLSVIQWLHTSFGATNHSYCYDHIRSAYTNKRTLVVQWLCVTYKLSWPIPKWSRKTHAVWYWQPQVVAMSNHLTSATLLTDVLRRL